MGGLATGSPGQDPGNIAARQEPAAPSGYSPGQAASLARLLRVLTWIFYTGFIVLWFKDNIHPFKKYRVSSLVALVPLVVVIGWRLVRAFRSRKISIRFRLDKTVLALVLLLILATVVRWPYLLHGERLVNSDYGIAALMGKHIAEGKVPPICFYGQNYQGSLSNHFYALFFLVFGYSIPVLHGAAIVFDLCFIIVQFLLLKDVFSFPFAVVMSLFYSLPFGQLLLVSLGNAAAFGLVLFLGSVILFLAMKIGFERKTSWLPGLGFVMGLAFWTHQIAISFILAAILLLLVKGRLGLKAVLKLMIYGVFGALPLLLQEVFGRFQLTRFLGGEGPRQVAAEKVKGTIQLFKNLLAPFDEDRLGTILVLVLLLGVASLLFILIRSKGRSRASVFLIFLAVFGGIYWLSRFSNYFLIRYLYPLYIVLPVLLLSPFYLLKSRLKTVLATVFVAAVVFVNGWPNHVSYAADVKRESALLRQIVEAMRATGARNWLADYWESYSLTAISAENPIVGTAYFNRYYPYQLAMYANGNHPGVLFLRTSGKSDDFETLLTTLGVTYRRNNIGEASLFFDIGSPVYPEVYYEKAPSSIPRLGLNGVREKAGFLEVTFRTEDAGPHAKFGLKVGIPGYSSATTIIPDEAGLFCVEIPAPPEKRISFRYAMDFRALEIPATAGEGTFTCAGERPEKRTDDVAFLHGIGPPTTRFDRNGHDCEREAALELRPLKSRNAKLRLELVNTIFFRDRDWYGRYVQAVRISVAGRPTEEIPLPDGRNVVVMNLDGVPPDGRRVVVTLKFRYGYVLENTPTQVLSAFLEKAEILD
jgi:hypothetical protein